MPSQEGSGTGTAPVSRTESESQAGSQARPGRGAWQNHGQHLARALAEAQLHRAPNSPLPAETSPGGLTWVLAGDSKESGKEQRKGGLGEGLLCGIPGCGMELEVEKAGITAGSLLATPPPRAAWVVPLFLSLTPTTCVCT